MGTLVKLNAQGNLVERFIEGYKSEATKRNYLAAIQEFANECKLDTWQINIDTIKTISLIQAQNYIKGILKAKKYGKAQVNRSALKSFWQEVIDTYELDIANVWNNKTIDKILERNLPRKTGLPKGKVLSVQQIAELINSIENVRDRLIIRIILNTGCRREEIPSMRWNKFRQVNGKWFATVIGKGDKEREVYINDDIIESIRTWKPNVKLGEDDIEMFWVGGHSINRLVKRYCKDIDIEGITAHQLRHTAATHMALNKASNIQLKDQFGWSSIATADKYIHYVDKFTNPAGQLVSF